MKKIIKIVLIILLIPILLVIGLIAYTAMVDYSPEKIENVYKTQTADVLSDTVEYNLMLWNIGYCGLGAEMDFFYDGGKEVRSSNENVLANLLAVKAFLKQQNNIDFFLLQEIDKDSKRSYHINQFESIDSALTNYSSYFGKNYDVDFVPQPITEPMGTVLSGLATYSKYLPKTSDRYSFPGSFDFPVGLFMLDRCFLVNRYALKNGKELLIINTHNSAYDDGSLKEAEMKYLKVFLEEEYSKGNYLIVGGDWNQCPPDFKPQFCGQKFDDVDLTLIKTDYLPADWKWVFSNLVPTNRRVDIPYTKGKTATTVIDFFLISPNIESLENENIDLGFKNSDHQPAKMKIRLK